MFLGPLVPTEQDTCRYLPTDIWTEHPYVTHSSDEAGHDTDWNDADIMCTENRELKVF